VTAFTSLGRGDPRYPQLVRELHDPPGELFVRGKPDVLAAPGVAVVGARSCSAYGAQVARSLARELADAGVVVISGLARGIDGEAHRGALEGGGRTVAVLGCGIDRDYPRSHAELARRIVLAGAVVSEYPVGVEPAPWRFPARNRIIAALALATVVVEARERSGALITADFALELGRDVFAVPGEITSALSSGTNDLLRQGAAPLTSVRDVLDSIGVTPPAGARTAPVSNAAAELLGLLGDGARAIDELTQASGLPPGEVAAALVELELAGLAAQAEGVYRTFSPGRSRVARERA
jgi:DNA processing protein